MVLVELSFKVHRGLITERAVEPRAVVKDFNPFKDRRPRLGARGGFEVGLTWNGGKLVGASIKSTGGRAVTVRHLLRLRTSAG